jgi:hypothetical protein
MSKLDYVAQSTKLDDAGLFARGDPQWRIGE